MIEQDTIKLLRECDAGARMGIASIDDVLDNVSDAQFKQKLTDCKNTHEKLKSDIQTQLDRFHDDGKNPNPVAQSMSWIKTNMMLAMHDSDKTVADLMTDGCNMGVKSLNRYLNQYTAADEASKNTAKELITAEQNLTKDIAQYL
ncbi:MAG: hypothetical protein MJ175_01905 [Clostridia bacterium]|nr:hypothetical protein [Clostridia bacterium]